MSMPKCWAWATDNANKVMWKKLQSVEQVQGQTFSIQKSETDLGATMQYNKTPCVGKLPERLAKACARLKKIAVLYHSQFSAYTKVDPLIAPIFIVHRYDMDIIASTLTGHPSGAPVVLLPVGVAAPLTSITLWHI